MARGASCEVRLGAGMDYVRQILKQMRKKAGLVKDHPRCGPVCWDTAGAAENLTEHGLENAESCDSAERDSRSCANAIANVYVASADLQRAHALLGKEPPYEDEE